MSQIISNKNEAMVNVNNTNKARIMKNRLELLFIEGNRQNIDKANVKEAYLKIKKHGYLSTMPMEYIPMDKAIGKLNGRTLSKVTITRKSGEGEAIVSNFDIKFQTVKIEEYGRFDGVCNLQPTQKSRYLKTWIFYLMSHFATMARYGKMETSTIQVFLQTATRLTIS